MAKDDKQTKDQLDNEPKPDKKIESSETATAKASDSPTKPLAKAGRRSAKALKEQEEKEAKASRKAAQPSEAPTQEGSKPKKHKPPRSRLERRGKNYRDKSKLIKPGKAHSLKEALDLATKTSPVKFDATIEIHARLNVDPKQSDQNVRSSVVLPSGTGKDIKVEVLTDASSSEILDNLEKSQIGFDVLITTPDQMPKLAKYAKLLGPKGLMPNPKTGTVTKDVDKAAQQAKAGKIEYRVDSSGIVHAAIGKVSFGTDNLLKNAQHLLEDIKQNKPSSIKGEYIKSIYVASAMGPSIRVQG